LSLDSSTKWQFVSARDNFGKYKSAWDALNQKYLRNHPLADSCFVEPLIKHFATDHDFLAVKSAGAEFQGMLLLGPGRFGVVGSFCPAQTEFCPVLVSSFEELQTLLSQLPFSTMQLDLYRQDPDYSIFPEDCSELIYEVDYHAKTVCVGLDEEFTVFWEARSSKLRKNIGRILRIIDKPDFNWRFNILETPQAVGEGVDRYGDLEVQGWKRSAGTAVHSTNKQGQFYRDIMSRFAERGNGIIYELYFDDTLVSSQMAIGNDSCLITLKTTYNESFGEYSPGKLLDYLMLQHEFQLKRYSRIEFCTNAGPDLIRWGTSTRPISDITVYRNEPLHWLSRSYRKLKKLKP
jgi:hypothetical protein